MRRRQPGGQTLLDTVAKVQEYVALYRRRDIYDRPPLVVVDGVGVGGGVVDQLRQKGVDVADYNGGGKAADKRHFLNLRAESHFLLRDLLEKGTVAFPPNEQLIEEASMVEYSPTPAGLVQVEAKEQLKKRLGTSTDFLDSLMDG